MKNRLSGILCTLIFAVLLISCKKDNAREHIEDVAPIIPDFTEKVTTDISGFIVDENNEPAFNIEVTAGNKTTTTDEFGYFHITGASVPEIAGLIKANKVGYFTGYKTFLAEEDRKIFIKMKLLPQAKSGSIDAVTGGAIALPGGAKLTLPSNAVVFASSGASYEGNIHVSTQLIDPSNIEAVQMQSPGDGRGTDDNNHLKLLNTYGLLATELRSGSGELLQIAPGREATITIPVPTTLNSSAPATIALWSFDETNGLWKKEGTATKNGSSYTGNVSHFSFWAGAVDIPLVQFSARIVNAALQPIANAAVGIRGATEPFNAGFGRFGYTDANGFVYGSIPANRPLVLNVLTLCETEAYSHAFNTAAGDIDLGTITGNLGQSMVTVSGSVVDCDGQPVVNGYVQLYDNGFYNRTTIVNGAFSFTGVACTNTSVSYVAIDQNTNQQSTPQTILLSPGVNDAGTLTACGTFTVSSISITIDGVTTVMPEPENKLQAFFTPEPAWTSIVKINSPTFNFQFDGSAASGTAHKIHELFSDLFPGGRAFAPAPLTVTITAYNLPGGFIEGSFSGLMLDFPANGIHNVSCNFRVRRFQ
jgi:hypothetical protein